jgi:hypothetical protein
MDTFLNIITGDYEPDYDTATHGDVSETLEFTLEGDGVTEDELGDKLADVIEFAESLGLKVNR